MLQLRYRWELAPLSDLFVVYSRGAALSLDASARRDATGFDDLFDSAWNDPILDQLVIKLRYRFGS